MTREVAFRTRIPKDMKVAKKRSKENSAEKVIYDLFSNSDMQTTKGMFHYLTDFLCNKLMFAGKWRSDINVTLTALECLAGLAQYDAKFVGKFEFILDICLSPFRAKKTAFSKFLIYGF